MARFTYTIGDLHGSQSYWFNPYGDTTAPFLPAALTRGGGNTLRIATFWANGAQTNVDNISMSVDIYRGTTNLGRRFSDAVEQNAAAFTVRAGSLSVVIPGPDWSGNNSRDTTDAYLYSLSTADSALVNAFDDAYADLTQAEKDATTLTISDGIADGAITFEAGSPIVKFQPPSEVGVAAGVPTVSAAGHALLGKRFFLAESGLPSVSAVGSIPYRLITTDVSAGEPSVSARGSRPFRYGTVGFDAGSPAVTVGGGLTLPGRALATAGTPSVSAVGLIPYRAGVASVSAGVPSVSLLGEIDQPVTAISPQPMVAWAMLLDGIGQSADPFRVWSGMGELDYDGETWQGTQSDNGAFVGLSPLTEQSGAPVRRLTAHVAVPAEAVRMMLRVDTGPITCTIDWIYSLDSGVTWNAAGVSASGYLSAPSFSDGVYSVEIETWGGDADRGTPLYWSHETQRLRSTGDQGMEFMRALEGGVESKWPP